MKPVEIKNGIWWAGVQNPALRVFDVIMETKWGTSYNSYLVKGSEKTVLIDSVKNGFFEEQWEGLKEICDPEKIDYIVCNHTEPDHSGSLGQFLDKAKNATVVCTRAAKGIIGELLNREFDCMVVNDGDTIDLGGKTLQFIIAPFLHWPDTMFTYVPEDKFLSSCDCFGFHFATPEIFDDLTLLDDAMVESQKYYFDVIMSPFKSYVLQGIEKIRGLEIDVIGPSHGPVLRHDPWGAVRRYEQWAQPVVNDPKKIFIGYVSCYGFTEKIAKKVAEGAMSSKKYEVAVEDIRGVCTDACAKVMAADAFALGSPTLNRDVLEPIWEVMTGVSTYVVKGKPAAAFGAFGWSGEAVPYMEQRLTNIGCKMTGTFRCKMEPTEADLQAAYDLGKQLAEALD